ncbi:2-succinyl-6-hydroxy-2,4-cyclohexadiene-1-carboxylate synthase [Vibrio kyushuensis]|uniref:2-succinyl-6-hydroxy-2, 4-cyclohexadiene-1-carboxylate synthase n=1 Tax=Vibrio kyushuensis TaxID=2910249 RepID=UPI003D0EFBB2
MLHSHQYNRPHTIEKPTLVFLHGLLGSGSDWQPCIDLLKQYACITLDLPGHGQSTSMTCYDFDDCCAMISNTLDSLLPPNQPVILIGYSMGGRVTMHGVANQHFLSLNLQSLIIEGGNFGLQNQNDKQVRLVSDTHWANRFIHEPIEQVLIDWYQQGVFSSLNHEQRQILVLKRSANLGSSVANMLLATSLAKQDHLLKAIKEQKTPVHYVCGERDNKFSQIARESGLSFNQVIGVGHNVHQESPYAFVQIINEHVMLNL